MTIKQIYETNFKTIKNWRKATHDPLVEIIAYNSEALIVIKANEMRIIILTSIYTVLHVSKILQKISRKLTKVQNHNYPNKLNIHYK